MVSFEQATTHALLTGDGIKHKDMPQDTFLTVRYSDQVPPSPALGEEILPYSPTPEDYQATTWRLA